VDREDREGENVVSFHPREHSRRVNRIIDPHRSPVASSSTLSSSLSFMIVIVEHVPSPFAPILPPPLLLTLIEPANRRERAREFLASRSALFAGTRR